MPSPVHICSALMAAMPAADLPWLGEVQTPPAMIPEAAASPGSLLVDGDGQAITTAEAWNARRGEIRAWWAEFMGLELDNRCDLAPEVLSEETVGSVVRKLIRYRAEPDCWVEAYVLHPAEVAGKLPGVVVFHSTVDHTIRQPAGLEGPESKFMGLRLAEMGYVAACPRNFIWDYCGPLSYDEACAKLADRHPTWKGMGKMVYDGIRAVDYLETLDFVDMDRIGCIGHSLGAKEVVYAAAFDERLKAIVSSEGGIGLGYTNWEAPWYLGEGIKDETFDHDNHEVLSLIAPRAFLLIGGESADGAISWPYIERAKEVYDVVGAGDRVGLLTHTSGHAFPTVAQHCAYGWLDHFLKGED
ncbi:MAG TPA: dienelactone hydrolase family protein [Armatimonadota bacterium]|nr:dienelactone hydrolase family protein [Armatimonadota bacterium]